jgi:ATP-dependent DNA ligase
MPLARSATLPAYVLPVLSTSAKPFDDRGCLFETKWDGIRALASVDGKPLRLWGREAAD